jgi:eukaryotic-like serine/threonine-protein kinase
VSPEEIGGLRPDSRSDIYSLGAVLFEMLTGKQRVRGTILRGLNPKVPPELDEVIAHMLAANIDSRAQSAATVAAELRSIAAILDTRAETAEAAEAFEPTRRLDRRRNSIVKWVLLAVVAGAVAFWLWRMQPWRLLR